MSILEHPNLRRFPFGRFGTTASLCVVALVLVAMFSSCTKTVSDRDVPMLTLKGKVLNPDGTPADQCIVHFASIVVSANPSAESVCCPSVGCCPPTSGDTTAIRHTISTDSEGNFEFSQVVPAGTKVMIHAYSLSPSRSLFSELMIFLAEKDREDITIQLLEGIRVEGTARFEDGTPIAAETVRTFRMVTPETVPGSEQMEADELQAILNTLNNPPMAFQATAQDDGKFEFYLPPGGYGIVGTGGTNFVGISISRDNEEEYHVDLVYSVPHGQFIKEDGSAPGSIRGIHVSNGGRSVRVPLPVLPDGRYTLLEKEEGTILIAITEDGLFGVIHPVPDDELDEFQTAILQPTATVTLRLHD